ncbi:MULTISPECIES: lipoyl(octanoyl) transferase LipB [unclassified Psychrobacter]|uniref:lipoyl(octanoyl) transferase LipB n=1 Tax=unclassified Psychrobacter TaxID=196806 RepID=UPI0025B37533|nr:MULTISPECIES: lipoyl(octanoyl) transferase LipB [unclassified Psychrobacter]MDN3452958.1 lipoyl(octanoyl) transferase LipB [Psychrobacter sp. APC 3350]MDN3501521.1 lipoyl(octanoyl) transferase LipB [Psychrobacter sp. 5A.1]
MQNDTQQLNDTLISKSLSAADYVPTLDAMLARTLVRIDLKKQQGLRTPDELWIVDHNDVYTLGQAGKEEHILQRTDTPIIKTDRGGQVTWHGHGQLVVYWLFDLHSLGWSVRNLVSHAEQAIEDVINECLQDAALSKPTNISAHARRDAPGVYLYADMPEPDSNTNTPTNDTSLDDKIMLGKMASLGFKIKHGFSYHGIAVNLNCDLSSFNAINPCGYAGMQMLRLSDFINMQKEPAAQTIEQVGDSLSYETVTQKLIDNIAKRHAGLIELRALAPK